MRVASRRLRAFLSVFSPHFDPPALRAFTRYVRGITRGLGVRRELDVSVDLLKQYRGDLHGPPRYAATHTIRRLDAKRRLETDTVVASARLVETPAFDALLMALFEGLERTRELRLTDAGGLLGNRLRALAKLDRRWRAREGAAGAEPLDDEFVHQIRIRFKKLRYACESYADLYGAPMKRFIQDLKGIQQRLGDWNDCRILRDYVAAAEQSAAARSASGFPELLAALDRDTKRHLAAYETESVAFFSTESMGRARTLFKGDASARAAKKAPAKRHGS